MNDLDKALAEFEVEAIEQGTKLFIKEGVEPGRANRLATAYFNDAKQVAMEMSEGKKFTSEDIRVRPLAIKATIDFMEDTPEEVINSLMELGGKSRAGVMQDVFEHAMEVERDNA